LELGLHRRPAGLAAVFGWLLLDEGLETTEIAGFALARLGVWLANGA